MDKIKQAYRLSGIKYPWVLLISMIVFMLSLYFQRVYRNDFSDFEIVGYGSGFLAALIWSVLNYFGHLKLNRLFKKYDNIDVFVEQTHMKKEEKEEFAQYLNDYVKDLEQKGEPHGSAVKKAINSFQVQEFSEAKGGDMFEKPAHYYLLGYTSVFVAVIIILQTVDGFFPAQLIISSLSLTLGLYAAAFFILFFLYKVIDKLLPQDK
jgi:hypothetical protein